MQYDDEERRGAAINPVQLRTVPNRFSAQLPNPMSLPRATNVDSGQVVQTNDQTRFVSVQSYIVPMVPGNTSRLAVDSAAGRRAFVTINNFQLLIAQAAPLLPGDEQFRIGISFDTEPNSFNQCSIQLDPGGSILLDQVIPQNRIFLFSRNLTGPAINIPVGIVVANFVG